MNQRVNLLPASRRRQRAAATRVRCWAAINLAALAFAAGAIVLALAMRPPIGDIRATMADVEGDIRAVHGQLAQLGPRLQDRRRVLEAIDHVRDQPNWAILLTLLSQLREHDAMLRSVRVDASAAGASVIDAALAAQRGNLHRPAAFNVHVDGLAPSQADVSSVVLACEQTGLFTTVKLVNTASHTFLDKPVTRFELQGRIDQVATRQPMELSGEQVGLQAGVQTGLQTGEQGGGL
jgi:hypothetical protein